MAGSSNRTIFARQVAGQNSLRNYIENASAHINTAGWVTYADTAQSRPVDGTGGTPAVTWSRVTSSPLSLDASFQFVKDAVNRQGQGVSFDFTIDRADQAKIMEVSFSYELISGTYSNGTSSTDSDMIVYVYDVTNARLIEPQQFKIDAAVSGQVPQFKTTFQTSGNSTSYRLILHVASTSASAYTINFDNFYVNLGDGKDQEQPSVAAQIYHSSNISVSSTYATVILNTKQLDTNNFYNTSTGEFTVPFAGVYRVSASGQFSGAALTVNQNMGWRVRVNGVVQYTIEDQAAANATVFVALDYKLSLNAGDVVTFQARNQATTPVINSPAYGVERIQGASVAGDQRVLVARAMGNPTSAPGAFPSWTTLTFAAGAESFDTHAALEPTTGIFTAPVSGYYRATGKVSVSMPAAGATTAYEIRLLKNNTTTEAARNDNLDANPGSTTAEDLAIDQLVQLNAGDNLRFQVRAQTATSFVSGDGLNYISFQRVQGPSSITATEFIGARYTTAAGQSIPNTLTFITVNFGTRDYDTHGAVTTGGSWQFTAPAAGYYEISATCTFDNLTWATANYLTLRINKTGSSTVNSLAENDPQGNATFYNCVQKTDVIYMAAGDTVRVQLFHNRSAGAATLYTDAGFNTIAIRRIGV